MALIRGLTSMYPCPICYVPWQEQSDLSTEHPQRVGQDSEQLIQEARAMRTAAEREELLKDHGLRDVEVSQFMFQSVLYSKVIECFLENQRCRSSRGYLLRSAACR
jgi:hypothetical protein